MAVHLSRSGHRRRQSARHPGRNAGRIPTHLGDGDEFVLRAAARQPDLHDGRHDHAPQPARATAGRISPAFRQISAATAFPRCGSSSNRCRPAISTLARAGARRRSGSRRCRLRRAGKAEQGRAARDLSLGRAEAVRAHHRPDGGGFRKVGIAAASPPHQAEVECWQAELGRNSVQRAAAAEQRSPLRRRHSGGARAVTRKGLVALSVARVADQRRPQAHRRHVRDRSAWSCCCAAFPTRS